MFSSLKSKVIKECYVTFVFAHGIVLVGSVLGFSAFLIPRLTSEKIVADITSESWIGSLMYIVSAIGSVAFSFVLGIYGRVQNYQFALIIYTVGYLILTFAPNIQFIYFGIGINALGTVTSLPMYATYISETCSLKRRSIFLSTDAVLESVGISMDYVLNSFLPWRVITAFWALLSFSGLLQSFLIPETSYWYMTQGQIDLAKKSMLWFQPNLSSHDLESQIEGMKNSIQSNSKTEGNQGSFYCKLCEMKYFKPFFLGSILTVLCTGAGRPIVVSYTVNVFEALNTPYNSETLATWFGVADLVGSLICLIIVFKFNKVFCFYAFSSVAVVSLIITIGYQFYASAFENSVPYLPIIGLFVYIMIMTSGFYAILYVIVIEMQFAEYRGQVMSFVIFVTFGMYFLYSKIFPYVSEVVEIQYIFLFFLLNISLTILLVHFFVPDNSNKLFYETGAL